MINLRDKAASDAQCHDFDDWLVDDAEAEVIAPKPIPKPLASTVTPPASPSKSNAVAVASTTPAPTPQPFPFDGHPNQFPGLFSRSGLFRVERLSRNAPAPTESALKVEAQGAYSLCLTGPRLSMNDKLVFESVVRLAKAQQLDLNDSLDVSLTDIAKQMGWQGRGGNSRDWIVASLERLARAEVEFRLPGGHQGSGLMLASASKTGQRAIIRFDPAFVLPCFGKDKQFTLDTARRSSLASPLAQWMHDFLSTHSEERDLSLGYLRDLCGFEAQKRAFPERLRKAMAILQASAPQLVAGFKIVRVRKDSDTWLLQVQRGTEKATFTDPFRPWGSAGQGAKASAKSAKQKGLNL